MKTKLPREGEGRDYFFKTLTIVCQFCKKFLEQNNCEKIAYCFNGKCPHDAQCSHHSEYRCPGCGTCGEQGKWDDFRGEGRSVLYDCKCGAEFSCLIRSMC